MDIKNIFKRLEVKFLLTQEQYISTHKLISAHATADAYGDYLVQSIYYDTDNWDIIRNSIEKPAFKQKMRLRCYGIPGNSSTVFLELKKKYQGIVYKRRLALPLQKNLNIRNEISKNNSLTGKEFAFYLKNTNVYERAHVSYNRKAFENDIGFRVTFDSDIRFRTNTLDYQNPQGGLTILPPELIIMEVKTIGGIPLWLVNFLSENKIYPHSFSKYGEGYKKYILKGNRS